MKITLKYRGVDLKVSGNKAGSRVEEKHLLRASFHRQLRRIWDNNNTLRGVDRGGLQEPVLVGAHFDVKRPVPFDGMTMSGFLFRHRVRDCWYVPLVTFPMEARVNLSLRVGRQSRPGSIVFDGGDLDGRLKTLFDALRIPKDVSEVPPGKDNEAECLCLLSDDSLITDLTITSYVIWDNAETNYIDLDLDVTITAVTPMVGTVSLLFG